MKNTMNYVMNGDSIEMLIDRGHHVSRNYYLREYCLKKDLSGKHILDYGFNNGNLLRSIPSDVNFTYTGVEVQEDFVTSMSEKYSDHNFIYFNKYHQSYNTTGDSELELIDVVSDTYDYIFAWNVFTHCTYEYTKECIEEMKAVLNTDGKIIFNVYSKEHLLSLSNIMVKRGDRLNGTITPLTSFDDFNNYVYWVNGQTLSYDTIVESNLSGLLTAYDIDWLVLDSGWSLRDNWNNRVFTFEIGA